jgi:DNA-binding response OmpR family regulator
MLLAILTIFATISHMEEQTDTPISPAGGQQNKAAAAPAATDSSKPSILCILLIEDEEMLASMYKTKFEKEGFSIDTASDGEAGIEKAKTGKFGVILVDIIMPKLDGFAVLKQLREMEQYKETPILLLTNLGQNEYIEKGKKLGASDYLVKANFTPSQVLEKIQSVSK